MFRVLAFALVTTALVGCASHAGTAARRRSPALPWSPSPKPAPAPKAAVSAPSGSTAAGMDTSVRARRRLLRIRERHLGQEHADSGRQVELWHVHRARGSSASSACATSSRTAKDDPEQQDRHRPTPAFIDEAAVEAKGLDPDRALARRDPRGQVEEPVWLCALRGDAAASASTARSRRFVGQDDATAIVYITDVVQAGLGMPDRDYYLLNRPKLVSKRGRTISST